jgi:uncharacterized repeat protein (TIGR01451 family)
MNHRFFATVLHIFLVMTCHFVFSRTVIAALIDQPMTGATAPGWTLGGTTSASLTGNGAIDPIGDGWLRLTNNTGNQAGYAYFNAPISLSQGALIQFDYVTWGGTGADGYTMFLFDASTPIFNIGATGGSLGYAQKTGINGISGGYLGIGVDEYGNFSNPSEGRYLGPGMAPNTVTVRGPVSSAAPPAGGMQGAQSYPWIATSANNGSLWTNQATRPNPTSAGYRRVEMRISPAPNPVVDVWIQFGFNQPLTHMISGAIVGSAPPSSLMLGYAASTGGSTNYHEIRNLVVEPSGYNSSINLGVTNHASVASIAVGSPITYTVIVRNFGPNNISANGVGIVDTIPSLITGVTWSCAATGGASCGSATGSGNNLNTTANLPFNSAVTYTISGTLTSHPGANLVNTASLVIPAGVTDYRSSDNSATSTIPVTTASLDLGIAKTTPATDYLLWDIISYNVVARNNGPASVTAYNAGITDTVPAELSGVSWTCTAAGGATCVTASGSGNSLNTSAHLPLNGTVTYTISGTLTSLPGGDTLSNTASLVIPAGYTDTNAANNSASVTISAAGSTPGSGNKPLYLYNAASSPARKLSRTPMTVTPASFVAIPRNTTTTWTLSPALQSAVTINSGAIPVQLWLSTDSTRTYSIPVSLLCGATTVATLTQNTPLVNGAAAAIFTFNLPRATNFSCPSGSAWALSIRNTQTAGTGRNIRVYPAPAVGSYSNASLASQNVININNSDIAFYSAPYPGGTTLASVNAGQTVHIRATVSDPFGSYDISSVTLTLRDTTGTVRLAPTAMTQVLDSGNATKIFEYAYTVPSAGPAGNWSALVVAAEGTEGTVNDNAQATMPVVTPPASLLVLKLADKTAAAPGDIITYTVTVTNTGAGTAGNVVVDDFLSPYIQGGLNSYGAGTAFQFVNGVPSSGLALGTPVYSNNNGTTWGYTPTSGAGGAPTGYDGNITNWRIPMNGTMNANNANFTINYKVRVK